MSLLKLLPLDIEEIIFDYKNQLEVTQKMKKSLKRINNIKYDTGFGPTNTIHHSMRIRYNDVYKKNTFTTSFFNPYENSLNIRVKEENKLQLMGYCLIENNRISILSI